MSDILIPDSITSEETIIFNELFARFGEIDLIPMLVYLVDYVDASALPHLAWQFHVTDNEGWKLAITEAEKRRLIKNAIPAHKIKGKVKGVKFVLETLGFLVELQEWFEYGGDPYHFKIGLSLVDREYDSETFNNLINLIDEYKNVRSVLDEISIESQFTMNPNCFSYTDAENEVIIG